MRSAQGVTSGLGGYISLMRTTTWHAGAGLCQGLLWSWRVRALCEAERAETALVATQQTLLSSCAGQSCIALHVPLRTNASLTKPLSLVSNIMHGVSLGCNACSLFCARPSFAAHEHSVAHACLAAALGTARIQPS